jgi:hypothetical protein
MKKKWIVVQNYRKKSPSEIKEIAEETVTMVGASAYFNAPNPTPNNPPLATITADIAALDTAISTPGGGPTKTDAIRQATEIVVNDLDLLGLYVQGIANMPANKTIGDIIIHAANMDFKKTGMPKARVFEVINSPAQQGDAIARAVSVGARAAYEWQYKRVNETNFTAAQITVKASYTFIGLTSGTKYQFRVKSINSKGNVNLSQVFELTVL